MRRLTLGIDLAAVILFTSIGRTVHTGGLTVNGLVSTTWPFAVGLAVGSLAVAMLRRPATAATSGLAVWISTVTIGMALRAVAGQGVAVAFVFVALGFLGATVLGWRALFLLTTKRSPVRFGRRP